MTHARWTTDPGTPTGPLGWAGATAVFAVEVALGVTAAVVGHRLGNRWLGPVGAWAGVVVAVVLVVLVWGRWMAPRSDHRIAPVPRIVLGSGLVVVAAAGVGLTGSPVWAWTFGPVGVLVLVGVGLTSR